MSDELTKQGSQDLSVPDFMRADAREGKEGIDLSSIRLPRLAIAQGLSHEMLPDHAAYIAELRLFEMFNNLTSEIYGRGPLKFIPIQHHVVRIEFDPNDPNIVLDRDVPANDPRCQWTEDPDGGPKGIPPKATRFTEVGVLLVRDGQPLEPIVISIKETNKHQVKSAERLTMFIMNTPGPIFGSLKTVETKSEKFDKGTAGVYVIKNLRMLGKTGGAQSPNLEGDELKADIELYTQAKKFYDNIKGKVIDVQRETAEDTSFDPANLESTPEVQGM